MFAHNEENKKRMCLWALNEKKRLTTQNIQNSKFKFSLKPFIYFTPMWERKQPLRDVPYS